MKAVRNLTGFKRVLTLVAVLAMTGTAAAKKTPSGPSIPGDLSPDRTSATVTVTVPMCNPTMVTSSTSVYIFQPSGRLLNIGTGNPGVSCDTLEQQVSVEVNAIPGLAFKPGPATLLIRTTTVDNTTIPATVTVSENGSRVDLRP